MTAANPQTAVAVESGETFEAPFPWEATPDVHSTVHVLAPAPVATFGGDTYPSLTIHERAGYQSLASFTVSLIGDRTQRREFARALHEIASQIARWESTPLAAVVDDAPTNPDEAVPS